MKKEPRFCVYQKVLFHDGSIGKPKLLRITGVLQESDSNKYSLDGINGFVDEKLLEPELDSITINFPETKRMARIIDRFQYAINTERDAIDLYLDLKPYWGYSSDKCDDECFEMWTPLTGTMIYSLRKIFKGMINEIKRLEKENEALKHIGK